jgi:Kef-type K+ transport system membrane component KefB
MREKLPLTIFFGVAAVLVAIGALARESAWLVLAAAVLVLLMAAGLVVGASLASVDDDKDRTWSPERLLPWRR